jgi:hypothetical protein
MLEGFYGKITGQIVYFEVYHTIINRQAAGVGISISSYNYTSLQVQSSEVVASRRQARSAVI